MTTKKIPEGQEVTETGFMKWDRLKPDLALWPPRAFEAVGRVLTYGAVKYSAHNWRKVDNKRRYYSAALRHIFACLKGELYDPDTQEHHLAHAICCLAFLLELDAEDAERADQ